MESAKDIQSTERRVQELVKKYKSLKTENEKLRTQLNASRALQHQLEKEKEQLQNQLSKAVMLKGLVVSQGDIEAAKKAVQSMIKEVDRCIQYLYK